MVCEYTHASCSAVVLLVPGDVVNVKAAARDAVLLVTREDLLASADSFIYRCKKERIQ